MSPTIEFANNDDLPNILALLENSHLPTEGLQDHLATTLIALQSGQIVGSVALEIYGSAALLRSLAVDSNVHRQGLGQQLTKAALDLAKTFSVQEVYLLTETASEFFPRFGFKSILRTEVAPAIHSSVEWSSACPVTAQAMVLHIQAEKV
ncbi:MAG TPA: arsenic resistance N-acetyltransferase ArsN2 [Ktedonobacteraceae bacterium]|jgi:amino-acid N-acetyltransferase|nr:arsenic resistance N-acetyltransferase ArsN2 [Ktedonobacteraceae bacterium]